MKAKLSLLVRGIFISVVAAELQTFLPHHSSRPPITSLFLQDLMRTSRKQLREHFVFILETSGNRRLQTAAAEKLCDRSPRWNYVHWYQGVIFFGDDSIEALLSNLEWSQKTLFVMMFAREHSDDKFYVEDVRHQNLKMNVAMKDEELSRYLKSDILPNGTRRTEIKRKIKTVLLEFLKMRILNVIVAKPQKSRVYIYTYFPYTEINCAEQLVPVLTNVWYSRKRAFHRERSSLFPEKIQDLFGCPLNVSVLLTPPALIPEGTRLRGIEGSILTQLFYFMNATPNFFFVNGSSDRSAAGMSRVLSDVRFGFSDIGAGFLVPTGGETRKTDCIYVSVNLCLTWAVPNRAKIKNFTAYFFETFTPEVWEAIGVTIIVSAVFFWLLLLATQQKRSMIASCTRVVLTILGQPGQSPGNVPTRMFLFCLICFSILLAEIFQAGMGSNKIVIQPRSQLDAIQDLIDSGLQIKGAERAVTLFKYMLPPKKMKIEYGELRETMMKVGLDRRTVYVGYKLPMKYFKNVLHPELRELIHIHRGCIVTYQPFLALKKNSPFSTRVYKFVRATAENGFSDWLYKYFTRFEGRIKMRKGQETDMILFYGGIQIWAYGLIISSVAFLCEQVFGRFEFLWGVLKNKTRVLISKANSKSQKQSNESRTKCQCKSIRGQPSEDKPSSI